MHFYSRRCHSQDSNVNDVPRVVLCGSPKGLGFLDVLVVKNSPANAGDIRDAVSVPGLGRSPGGEHGNPLHNSCLENPVDRGAWQVTVSRVAKESGMTTTPT